MCSSVSLKILGILITPVASTIETFKKFLRNVFASMLFKFTSEHKLFIAVVTFVDLVYDSIYGISMYSEC